MSHPLSSGFPVCRTPKYRNGAIPLLRRSTAVVLPLIRQLARFRVPGVCDALDSNHCLLEILDPEMPKLSSATSSHFMISELLMWSALLLVNGNVEMPIPEMPKKCLAAIFNFGLSSLLCPDHSSSGPPKPQILKF
jgi:hypothetical protein